MVGCVRVLAEERDVLQANHAADCDEKANDEDDRDGDSGPRVLGRESQQLGGWEDEDEEVEGDVDRAIDVEPDSDLNRGAGAMFVLAVPLCPEEIDWPALETKGDHEASSVDE